MILSAPWGLLALAALPAILAIHLFRRRFAPRPVTALWLYGRPTFSKVSGRRRERLRHLASLYLELAAALAATWYLCDPHLSPRMAAVHHAIVLDTRMAMGARPAGDSSSLERGRDRLRALVAALPRDDRVTLIASGRAPVILAGPAARPSSALAALNGWRAEAPWHDLESAWRLAWDQLGGADAGGRRRGRLLVVSDREVPLPAGAGLLATGRPLANDGFAQAVWLRESGAAERLALRVARWSAAAGKRRVLVENEAGALLAEQWLTLPAAGEVLAMIPLPAEPPPALRLRLDGTDALAVDDSVGLLRPPARPVTVAFAPELAGWEPVLAAVPDLVRVTPPAVADLTVGGPSVLPVPRGTWTLTVAAGGGPAVFGPFLARRGHPLLADLDFNACLWSGGTPLADLPAEAVLLAAGDHALISLATRGADQDLRFHLDLTASGLARHPVWPALISNLIAWRRRALPGVADPNLLAGAPWQAVAPPGTRAITLTGPGLSAPVELVPGEHGRMFGPPLDHPGRYALTRIAVDGGTEAWGEVQLVLTDARAGDLRQAATLAVGPRDGDAAAVARERGPLAHLLPLVILGLLILAAWRVAQREACIAEGSEPSRA